jgi:hypothetical protein
MTRYNVETKGQVFEATEVSSRGAGLRSGSKITFGISARRVLKSGKLSNDIYYFAEKCGFRKVKQ